MMAAKGLNERRDRDKKGTVADAGEKSVESETEREEKFTSLEVVYQNTEKYAEYSTGQPRYIARSCRFCRHFVILSVM